jgi:ribosome-associated heat shock protein Hsp15
VGAVKHDEFQICKPDVMSVINTLVRSYYGHQPIDFLQYENGTMTSVRMDKWLWAARFFKTRALAAKACELGRITSNGQPAKPSREVRTGDVLQVKNEGGDFQIEVLMLSDMRGPAAVAQALYRETEASKELRLKLAEERKAMPNFEAMREGKPSKRDRREIDRFRGRF